MQLMTDTMHERPMDALKDQDDVVKALKRAISESREVMESDISEYDRNWKYYMGQHYLRNVGGRWMSDGGSGDKLRLQRDIIQISIDALRPILVKMKPHIVVLASYPTEDAQIQMKGQAGYPIQGLKNSDVATFMAEALKREHRRRHEDTLMAEMVLEVMVTGQAWRCMMPVFTRQGVMIEPKLYPQHRVLKDPKGTRLADLKDFGYLIFEDELDASEIKQLYGVDEQSYTQETNSAESTFNEYDRDRMYRGMAQFRRYGKHNINEEKSDRRIYKIHTAFFNNASSDMVSYHEKPSKLNYPFGRMLVMINEQYLAIDKPNPFWHGEYPVTCYQALPIPHMGKALNEVGKLKDVQKAVNILMNALIGTTLLGLNPKLFYEEGAFNPQDWTSTPGGMIRFAKGALSGKQVDWHQPGGMDRGAYQLLKDLEYYGKEDVAGVTAALQGQELSAGSSGVYANTLQSAAMTGPTFRIEMLDAGHHRNATQEIELYQQFVDFRKPYYSLLHDIDQYHPFMQEAIRDLYYRIEYESQAELPHNPIARHNFFFNQFDQGIIDFEEYIQKANISMRPELREKARQNSLEAFMPGVPRQMRLELMVQVLTAQAQEAAAAQNVQKVGQQAGGGGAPQIAGNDAEMAPGVGGGIAGDPDQSSL